MELFIKAVVVITALIIAAVSGVGLWTRNQKVKSAGEGTASRLASGKLDIHEVAAGLDMMIRRKTVAHEDDLVGFIQKADAISTLPSKYVFHRIEKGILDEAVFIVDGIFRDMIVNDGKIDYKDIHYNCWLHILVSKAERKVEFYGQFPHDKEHQYLLEDLADLIFEKAMKMTTSQVVR